MRANYQDPESRDPKAKDFWANLTSKLGVTPPLSKQAAAPAPEERLSDGLQTHGHRPKSPGMIRTAAVEPVGEQQSESSRIMDGLAEHQMQASGELSQEERVKVADRLSRICNDMETIAPKVDGLSGQGQNFGDLCGEIKVKADALHGSCEQLHEKAGEMTQAQAKAIENVFLIISDAKTYLDKIGTPEGAAPLPDMALMSEELPEMPPTEADVEVPGTIAKSRAAMTKTSQDEQYEDLRCIHTKLSLAASMLDEIVVDLNVGAMLPGPEMPESPKVEQMGTPENPVGAEAVAAKRAALVKTAASGDPGDSEPGNSVYKDINKCRDCVWFESDHTHETYRDKCKCCVHAKLDGTTEHWWPRSQQMIIWAPQWGAPEASENKVRLSFQNTLSLRQVAPTQEQAIAREVVSGTRKSAVSLGEAVIAALQSPVLVGQMPRLARAVIAEVESLTGIVFSKNSGVEGEMVVAYPQEGIEHEAKGERAKIRVLRIQLEGETHPEKIKSLHEAIKALEERMKTDSDAKEERRKKRDEKSKKEESDRAVDDALGGTARFEGSLCLADAFWPSETPDLGPGESFPKCFKCGEQHATDAPCKTPEERAQWVSGGHPSIIEDNIRQRSEGAATPRGSL